jgi:DNA-binding transcriptional LysR family regulator
MDLDQIEAFLAVARLRSFTRAAGALHLSQPAVSRRIDLLEHQLGTPVFERVRGSSVILTEAGRAFLPHGEGALARVHDGVHAVRALAHGDSGSITLALVGTLADTKLTKRLRRFRIAYPRVRLVLRTANSAEVTSLVRRGDATLGLRYGASADPDVVSTRIGEERMIVVCAPDHRLATRARLRPSALAGEPWVTFPIRPGGGDSGRVLERQLAAAGLSGAETVMIDSLTAQKRFVETGFGLGLVPESGVREELRLGTLRKLLVPAMHTTMTVVLIHRRHTHLTGAARRLMAVLGVASGARRHSVDRG